MSDKVLLECRRKVWHAFSFFFCRFWRHGETGRVCELPFWRTPGKGWARCNWKE